MKKYKNMSNAALIAAFENACFQLALKQTKKCNNYLCDLEIEIARRLDIKNDEIIEQMK